MTAWNTDPTSRTANDAKPVSLPTNLSTLMDEIKRGIISLPRYVPTGTVKVPTTPPTTPATPTTPAVTDTTPPAITDVTVSPKDNVYYSYKDKCGTEQTKITVRAKITDASGVASVKLNFAYKTGGGIAGPAHEADMTSVGSGYYQGVIDTSFYAYADLGGSEGTVSFHVTAYDMSKNLQTGSSSSVPVKLCGSQVVTPSNNPPANNPPVDTNGPTVTNIVSNPGKVINYESQSGMCSSSVIVTVTADITDDSAVGDVTLWYRFYTGSENAWWSVPMTYNSKVGKYEALIDTGLASYSAYSVLSNKGGSMDYYIIAKDSLQNLTMSGTTAVSAVDCTQ